MDINVTFTEEERQIIVRALALQSIEAPGWCYMHDGIVKKLHAVEMFDNFTDIIATTPPADRFNRDSKIAQAMEKHKQLEEKIEELEGDLDEAREMRDL